MLDGIDGGYESTKARCILKLFRGALTQNKLSSDFLDHIHVCNKLSISRSNM
jgi:hypothetical protein